MDFSGKTVLVTGGSRGIGRAIAIAFAGRGARVAIAYRSNKAAAEQTLGIMDGTEHLARQADISDAKQAATLIDGVVAEFGRLHILVNNAGVYLSHPPASTDYEDWQTAWRATLDTNLIAAANLCHLAAQHMIEQGGGRIVNVSSRGAFRGEPEHPAYAASKAGLNALSQSLAIALAPQRIIVGAVAPGFVDTELAADILDGPEGEAIRAQSPFQRVAEPQEVAHAVLFLASEGAEFTSGAILDLNGASYLRS